MMFRNFNSILGFVALFVSAACNTSDLAANLSASADTSGTGTSNNADPATGSGGSSNSSIKTKRYVCDPFRTPEGGQPQVVGSLYAAPYATTLQEYQEYLSLFGTLEKFFFKTPDGHEPYLYDDVVLRLSAINTLPRTFNQGFPVSGTGSQAELLKVAMSNEDLVEWFAMKLRSKIKLGPNDSPGYYQFATISDDGVRFKFKEDSSNWIIEDSIHPPMMTCATSVKYFDATTEKEFEYEYFQGPRFEIASALLWRKIDDPNAALPPAFFCERTAGGGPNSFVPIMGDTLDPAFNTVEGWSMLTSDNFELPDDVTNLPPCQ